MAKERGLGQTSRISTKEEKSERITKEKEREIKCGKNRRIVRLSKSGKY